MTSLRARCSLVITVLFMGACDGEIRLDDDASIDSASADGAFESTGDGRSDVGGSCKADPDCKLATLHCYLPAAVCVPCLTDAHCTSDGEHRCDTAAHRCVECGVASDCSGDETCEPITRRCVHRCGDGGGCSSDEKCDSARGICVECTDDSQCTKDAKFCEKPSGRCVQCVTDASCSASGDRPRCDATRAVCVHCLTGADCGGDKPLCDPASGECVGKS